MTYKCLCAPAPKIIDNNYSCEIHQLNKLYSFSVSLFLWHLLIDKMGQNSLSSKACQEYLPVETKDKDDTVLSITFIV